MHTLDLTQNKQIKFIITAVIALGALSTFLVYLDNKKHARLKSEIMDLEKQIKAIQLETLKNGKA